MSDLALLAELAAARTRIEAALATRIIGQRAPIEAVLTALVAFDSST